MTSFRFVKKIEFGHLYATSVLVDNKVIIPLRKYIKVLDLQANDEKIFDKNVIELDDILIRRYYTSNTCNTSMFRVYSNHNLVKLYVCREDMSLLNRYYKLTEEYENTNIVPVFNYSKNDANILYLSNATERDGYDEELNPIKIYQLGRIFLSKRKPSLVKLNKDVYFNFKDNRYILTDEENPNPHWFDSWDY
ncbi:MAG TPA: hypothetical protein ENO30_06295 [Thermodesulfobium narugense]|nr:hypothetical protein [Thermodesulfobium narugense]